MTCAYYAGAPVVSKALPPWLQSSLQVSDLAYRLAGIKNVCSGLGLSRSRVGPGSYAAQSSLCAALLQQASWLAG